MNLAWNCRAFLSDLSVFYVFAGFPPDNKENSYANLMHQQDRRKFLQNVPRLKIDETGGKVTRRQNKKKKTHFNKTNTFFVSPGIEKKKNHYVMKYA